MSDHGAPTTVVTDAIRVTDLDHQRHVGNTAFTDIFANGRFAFLNEHVRPVVGTDALIALVRSEVEIWTQVHHPATVETTTWLATVGRTSMQVAQTMSCAGVAVAECRSVLVLTDRDTGASTPWPEPLARWRTLPGAARRGSTTPRPAVRSSRQE